MGHSASGLTRLKSPKSLSAGLGAGADLPRAHPGGCQNSVACGCRAVFPFLAGCQRGALLSCLKPLASWVFKPAVMPGSPPLTSDVSDLPSAASLLPPSRETSLLLIAQVIKEDP